MNVLDRILKRDVKEHEDESAAQNGAPAQAANAEQPKEDTALRQNAEAAAKYLLKMENDAKLRYDMREYIESRDFLGLMAEYDISAAVRIYEAERFANEAYQAGRDEAIEEIYKRREMPRAMRSGTGAQADLDYSRMSSDEFSRLRDRLARG